jgi:hypothetical protein
VFLINSRSHLVSAASPSSRGKPYHQKRRTFSRSYGTILPSSFTRVLSRALVCSTRLPVSVYGTVSYELWLAAFPGSMASITSLSSLKLKSTSHLSLNVNKDLPHSQPSCRCRNYRSPAQPSLLRPHFTTHKKSRNINLVPINYASRPRLRGRLTLLRLTSCRNP